MAETPEEISRLAEKFRLINEPNNHWEARKQFILRNWSDYPEMQLVSLSMVWANMKFDGCKYSPELMDRVQDMAAGISAYPTSEPSGNQALTSGRNQDSDQALTSAHKRQRLAPSDALADTGQDIAKAGSLSEDVWQATDVEGNRVNISKHTSLRKLYPASLVPTRTGADWFDRLSEICSRIKAKSTTCGDAPNYLVSVFLAEVRSVLNKIEIKCISNEVKHKPQWKAHFIIFDVLCATHVARSKKDAKDGVVTALVNLWTSHNVISLKSTSLPEGGEFDFQHEMLYLEERQGGISCSPSAPNIVDSTEKPNEDHKVIRFETIMEALPRDVATHPLNCAITPAPKIQNFVLLELLEDLNRYGYENPVGKLFNSAARSKVPINFHMEKCVIGMGRVCYKCTVYISSLYIATGLAPGAREAKHLAAHNAVQAIKMTNVTLRKTKETEGPNVSRSELTDASAKEEVVPETNVGHKLLKMMGWKGEGVGLGKKEEGIANPVKATGSGSRTKEGLGFDLYQLKDPTTKRLDLHKAYNFLHDYMRSDREDELVFTSELNLEERKKVHTMCMKLGLKSKSKGKGNDRFLVISRKRDMAELVQALSEKGGSIGTYELVGPSL